MAFKTPPEITAEAVETGVKKSEQSWDKTLVGAFLAGAYIAFGALLAVVVSAGLSEKLWGNIPVLITGGVFTVGLMLVIIGGAELATGNMATAGIAVFKRRVTCRALFVPPRPRAARQPDRCAAGGLLLRLQERHFWTSR